LKKKEVEDIAQQDDGQIQKAFSEQQEIEKQKTEEQLKKQEELFRQLDKDYEFARMATHTHRGVGLGFQSHGMP